MIRYLARRPALAGAARPAAALSTAVLSVALLAGCSGTGGDGAGHGGAQHDGGTPPNAATTGPSGAVFNAADVTFASAMIPHHQQAVEMARAAATRAGDQRIKDLAAKIEKAQQPELETMSGWLRAWGKAVPTHVPGTGHAGHAGMPGAMTDQQMADLLASSGTGFDRMFLKMMIVHHQGAIDMAGVEQRDGRYPPAKDAAAKIASDQAAEIATMRALIPR